MVKKITVKGAAQQIISGGQPVSDFRVVNPSDPRAAPPKKKPLPADLARALGQVDQS